MQKLKIKQESLIIRPVSNGWIVEGVGELNCALAVFNYISEMQAWIGHYYSDKEQEDMQVWVCDYYLKAEQEDKQP